MVFRIAPDKLRDRLEDYLGDNSWLFQGAISLLVEKIHDFASMQRQSFLLDGMLSHYDVVEKLLKARELGEGNNNVFIVIEKESSSGCVFAIF